MHAQVQVCLHTLAPVCMHAQVQVCLHALAPVCMHAQVQVCLHIQAALAAYFVRCSVITHMQDTADISGG